MSKTTSYVDKQGVKHWGVMARAVQERETRKEDHTVRIMRERLTDGSHVFMVRLGNVTFPAISEAHATCLAVKLADAINQHTNELARVF